jgi:hypothetical protein
MMPSNLKVSGVNVALAQMSCGTKGRKTGACIEKVVFVACYFEMKQHKSI